MIDLLPCVFIAYMLHCVVVRNGTKIVGLLMPDRFCGKYDFEAISSQKIVNVSTGVDVLDTS